MGLPNVFILYDIEYTAWKGSQERNWGYSWEEREIIQISAFKIEKVNKFFYVKEVFNIYIKPVKNPILSNYITKLTGITNRKLKAYGTNIKVGLRQFYDFCSSKKGLYHIFSYGNDYKIIKENLLLNKIHKNSKLYKMGHKMHDIRYIFKKQGINTDNYSSGEIYKYFNRTIDDADIHNSLWDIKSQFIALNELARKGYIL